MKNNRSLKIAVAETSVIVRTGIVSILKQLSDIDIYPIEVVSMEDLKETVQLHNPDMLIINPGFEGWFDVTAFKEKIDAAQMKYVALIYSVVDSSLLKSYDETISVYDDMDALAAKINDVSNQTSLEEIGAGKEPLSQREKEIIVCVVKGMTNKAIADQLFLSIHTVITHRRNIARKLEIHSTAGLTIYAIVNKLIELKDIENASL